MGEYVSRYRLYKMGGFARNFEQIIKNVGKGIQLTKLTSMDFFMSYSAGIFDKMGLKEESDKVKKLLDEWNYWISLSPDLDRRSIETDFYSLLYQYETLIVMSFTDIVLDAEDMKLRSMCIHTTPLYYEYVKHLLEMRQKEVFYEILSMIWLNIHANKMIDLSEIQQLVSSLKASVMEEPDAKPPPDLETVDTTVDDAKMNLVPNKIENTPLGFKKVLKIMMPLLDVFKDNFYRDTKLNAKLANAEIYTFSLIMTAKKIMPSHPLLELLPKEAYSVCKHINNYELINSISKFRGVDTFIINDLKANHEKKLGSMILDLFEKGQKFLVDLEKTSTGAGGPGGPGEEDEKRKVLVYELKKVPVHPESLVGFDITHDDISTIVEMLKTGEKLTNVQVDVEPFHKKFKDLPPITLIFGMTGCLSKNTRIPVIDNGVIQFLSLEQVFKRYSKRKFGVYSYNFDKKRLEQDLARILFSGKKKLYKVTLESGKTIYATDEHRFFRKNENKTEEVQLKDLNINDKIFSI